MEYTEHGLKISLEELKNMLERAENYANYCGFERTIYINGSERPRINQYCLGSDPPIDHIYDQLI